MTHDKFASAGKMDAALVRALLESAPDAMVVIQSDGTIFMVNAQAERLFGYAREEILGKPIEILVPEHVRRAHIAHRNRFISKPQVRPMASGISLDGRRSDGSEFPVEVSLSPLITSEATYVSSTIRDASMKAIQNQEESFARILERSLNEIFIFDAETFCFLHANGGARTNLGYSMGELRELSPVDIKPDHSMETFVELVAPLKSGNMNKVVFETRHLRKNGTVYSVEVHLELSSFRGKPAFVAVILDITERQRLKDELAAMNAVLQDLVDQRTRELSDAQAALVRKERLTALGQLAGGVAHEVRTPLGAIQNAAYYLRMREDCLDEEMRDALGDVENGVATAEGIISELLAYGRSSKQQRDTFAVSAVVAGALASVEVPEMVNVDTCIQAAAEALTVEADRGQVERLISNLARNAVQAMPRGGTLSISANAVDSDVIIDIADTGIGISEEDLLKVFEPLFTSKARGIGLGLSVARRYAELNRGTLTVTSELGVGSRFRLKLPFSVSAELPRELEQ